MSKTIGARIDDEIYKKIQADPRSNTEILRSALEKYYSEHEQKNNDKTLLTPVNNMITSRAIEYLQQIVKTVVLDYCIICNNIIIKSYMHDEAGNHYCSWDCWEKRYNHEKTDNRGKVKRVKL